MKVVSSVKSLSSLLYVLMIAFHSPDLSRLDDAFLSGSSVCNCTCCSCSSDRRKMLYYYLQYKCFFFFVKGQGREKAAQSPLLPSGELWLCVSFRPTQRRRNGAKIGRKNQAQKIVL